jgi:RNA polymerase sigma-70 factor (ECF subfamily)
VDDDAEGFAGFYERALDGCFRAVLASTGDWQAAEDLVAEAFTRAWVRWRAVSRHPMPEAWVVRTALNTRVTWWRRRRREVPFPESIHDQVDEYGLDNAVDRTVMAALLQLPLRQRQVVALRIFLDLDTACTAQTLGIAPGTVTAHLTRAIAALRKEISPIADTETIADMETRS